MWYEIRYPKNIDLIIYLNLCHSHSQENHKISHTGIAKEFTEKCDVHSQSCCFSLYTNSLPGDSEQVWGQGREKDTELAVTS